MKMDRKINRKSYDIRQSLLALYTRTFISSTAKNGFKWLKKTGTMYRGYSITACLGVLAFFIKYSWIDGCNLKNRSVY